MTEPVKLKNHVAPKGGRLARVLKSKFGITLADFNKAVMGDIEVAQKIGEMARQGRLNSELAPRLAQAYIEIINGSEAYNKATADILMQAGKSAIAIGKNVSQVTLASTKYANQGKEITQEFKLARKAEKMRHNYQMNYAEIRGYIDAHLVEVDQQTAMLEQSLRPEIKQVAADEQLHNRQLNEVLNNGDNARFDLIPEKQYQTTGLKAKLLAFKAALGF